MIATQSRLRWLAAQIRRAFAEFDSAQQRLFELKTGVRALPTPRQDSPRLSVEELEALFELDHPGDADRV